MDGKWGRGIVVCELREMATGSGYNDDMVLRFHLFHLVMQIFSDLCAFF